MGMVAKKIREVPPSGIREFFDLVLGMPEVISLGVGEPDFITPWRIREKAITALEEGYTSYTSNKGLYVLRKGISQNLKKKYGLSYGAESDILITFGVSEGLDLALRAILEPKDKVIVVSPHYVAYPALVEINNSRVVYLPTTEEEGFKINPAGLIKLIRENKPRAIILNYPSNPTGITYTSGEIKKICRVLEQRDIIVISDETYDELTYQDFHVSLPSLSKTIKKKTILLNGFSKNYAMTGFRVGFACANREIISAMTKIHSYSALCAPIVSQIAGVEALGVHKEVKDMRSAYRKRRDFVVKELRRLGMSVVEPQGAFYCFPSIKTFGMNSLEFAKKLLMEEKVAAVPGRAFGKEYDGYVRISYANSLDNLKESVLRIENFLKRNQKYADKKKAKGRR